MLRDKLIYDRDGLFVKFLIILPKLLKSLIHGYGREPPSRWFRYHLAYRDQGSWWAGDFRGEDFALSSWVLNPQPGILPTLVQVGCWGEARVLSLYHIPGMLPCKRPEKLSCALKGYMLTVCTKEMIYLSEQITVNAWHRASHLQV